MGTPPPVCRCYYGVTVWPVWLWSLREIMMRDGPLHSDDDQCASRWCVVYTLHDTGRYDTLLLWHHHHQQQQHPPSVFTHISADSQVETIYNHKVDFHIYTDGCVLISSNYSSGSAAIICSSHSVEAPQVLSRLTSSSTDQVTPPDAEVAAISLAMSWLQDQDCDPS